MQQQCIVHTPHEQQTEAEACGSLGGLAIVIWGSDLSVSSSLHALLLIPFWAS